jgi:ribosomal protein L37AE/L43A
MHIFRCDGCGAELTKGQLRYNVKIEVKAAYDELEIGLADLVRDHRAELNSLIHELNKAEAKEVEETVYKSFSLHLCPSCQRGYLSNPLRFHPEQPGDDAPVDIDAFLRSLGANQRPEDSD